LERPVENHLREFAGRSAKSGKHQEQRDIHKKIEAHPENASQPGCERNRDDLSNQITGGNPGSFDGSGADPAGDLTQGGIGNLDVEHRHKSSQDRTQYGDPGA